MMKKHIEIESGKLSLQKMNNNNYKLIKFVTKNLILKSHCTGKTLRNIYYR